jgi:hypothetical protein
MKTTTKYFPLLLILFFSVQAHAQKHKDKSIDTVGVLMTMADDTMYMCTYKDEPIKLASEDIWFYDGNGKKYWRHQDEIKWMKIYDRVFLCIPRDLVQGDALSLMEVLARNEKYFLVSWWSINYFYFILDIHGNPVMQNRRANHDEKLIEDVSGYFKDCPELTRKMKANFRVLSTEEERATAGAGDLRPLSTGIKNLQCQDNALSIESITDMLNKKPWYDKFEATAKKKKEKEKEKEEKKNGK